MKKELSKISKKSKMIAATAFILGLTVVGGGFAYASTTPAQDDAHSPMKALVSAIATKFNLNESDVKTVVDEVMTSQREAMQKEQQQRFADRLSKAVTDGKLTQAQADLITAKMTELKASMDAARTTDATLTQAEREAKMKAAHDELAAWAKANGISEEYLHPVDGRGHGGFGGPNGAFGTPPAHN